MRTVADVMTHEVRSVHRDEVVGPIRDLMLDGRLHGVPVVDDDGSLVGIVTASDLVEQWAPQQGVATVMTEDVLTTEPATSVAEAARTMLEHRVHHLVVVGGGVGARDEVVGVLSTFDLLRELARSDRSEPARAPAHGRATPGDIIVIRGHAVGHRERRGVIVDTRGPDGGPPFVVNWLDDPHTERHDVLFSPGSDADIEHPDREPATST